LLLQQPDTTTSKGRRDLTLLSLMYDTGARVQETIDFTPSMLRLNKPATIKIVGKGNKARLVPMLDAQTEHLKNYLKENRLNEPFANIYPLFFNSRKEKLTRAGINFIVQKYIKTARKENKMIIPEKISLPLPQAFKSYAFASSRSKSGIYPRYFGTRIHSNHRDLCQGGFQTETPSHRKGIR